MSNLSFKGRFKKSNKCVHSYYKLSLFINKNKINQIKLIKQLNKNNVDCGVGSCPEIYREKIFKKLKFFPKKDYQMQNYLVKQA